ncbi:hypothetical protein SEA_LYMARA_53 [Arthrobacter phage Lymara]|uniref:Uncharacterized protein n=1 Tax=Arthrobacter phage Lymara TaxID=2599828 RepID=A0A5J6TXT0_9CAUD|nr:hypothetical protein HYQ01_gp053 [Arthrobacter phage Lymara]QFG14854.1 hypothetical protein SEA_LYMARA_53 [Arthrobacter phage Lymara]
MTTTPTGMTNNQAALFAAATLNANRNTNSPRFIEDVEGFKLLLDTLDQRDAEAAEKARVQAMPGYCNHHLKAQYQSHWGNAPLDIRPINPGEQCNAQGCFQDDPTNINPKNGTEK